MFPGIKVNYFHLFCSHILLRIKLCTFAKEASFCLIRLVFLLIFGFEHLEHLHRLDYQLGKSGVMTLTGIHYKNNDVFYLDVFDLQAAQLLQGHTGVLPQQTDPILQPADGGDGVSRCLALQQCHRVHSECLIGWALANDGWWPVCEHCRTKTKTWTHQSEVTWMVSDCKVNRATALIIKCTGGGCGLPIIK